jgi:hypothetical protein
LDTGLGWGKREWGWEGVEKGHPHDVFVKGDKVKNSLNDQSFSEKRVRALPINVLES